MVGPSVNLSEVCVRRRGKAILGPISLSLGHAEFTIVLGPNGAGKTTLLKVLHGVERLSAGTVTWSGGDAAARGHKQADADVRGGMHAEHGAGAVEVDREGVDGERGRGEQAAHEAAAGLVVPAEEHDNTDEQQHGHNDHGRGAEDDRAHRVASRLPFSVWSAGADGSQV